MSKMNADQIIDSLRGILNSSVLHLATNIRYVFDCCEWLNKKCKNDRMLVKPWVQRPPLQPRDWRVTEVYPAQATAVSPFKPRSRSLSPSQRMNRTGSPTRSASPYRAASVRFKQQQQQLRESPVAREVMPSLEQKLQADLDRYRRSGQENLSSTGRQSMSSTQRHKPAAYRSPQDRAVQGQGRVGENHQPHGMHQQQQHLQSAQSVDNRRGRLVHQRTADVVPRLDSLGYGAPVKHMLPTVSSTLGRRGQMGRASAPPWTAAGQSGRRLSPSRFAEREQEPLLTPGLAKSQRIGAMY